MWKRPEMPSDEKVFATQLSHMIQIWQLTFLTPNHSILTKYASHRFLNTLSEEALKLCGEFGPLNKKE
jgi:hypothetical protein